MRWLAGQFAQPHGMVGRLIVAPWLNCISRAMNRLVLEQLQVGRDDDVLEIGFGGAALLTALRKATRGQVTGVDLSASMVARARRRFRGVDRVAMHQASVDALPLADASVDKACSVNSLYFWPDPATGFRELARVVRPGGLLAVAFEPPEELRKWPGSRFGFRLFDEAEVRQLMEAAGFTAIRRAEGKGRKPDFFLCLTGERVGGEAARW
jgi:arsenite methyltransferase